MFKKLLFFTLITFTTSCYQPERNCKDYKNGTFSFTSIVNKEEVTSTFTRNNAVEVDFFNKKTDTSSVRWINNCEYILKKLNPKNKAEEKSIHVKILSTTKNSYTFEYNIVGDQKKSKGTAIKIN